jgi:hypothetical protein
MLSHSFSPAIWSICLDARLRAFHLRMRCVSKSSVAIEEDRRQRLYNVAATFSFMRFARASSFMRFARASVSTL